MAEKSKKKTKRFDLDAWRHSFFSTSSLREGHFGLAIEDREIAIEFTLFVTEFNHLEEALERFAAFILQTDGETAAHILRSIASAKARILLLRNVLQRARHNSKKPEVFDCILNDFEKLNDLRNKFVHAKYMTSETGEVLWLPRNQDTMLVAPFNYMPFPSSKLSECRSKIRELHISIAKAIAQAFAEKPDD